VNIKYFFSAAIVWSLLSASVQAGSDPRIRVEEYRNDSVFDIYATVGRATLIQLEADESLGSSDQSVLGVGDAEAWNIGVRGNNIVLKPRASLPRTNIVIVTNKRTYSFDLKIAPKNVHPTYILRFKYPESEALQIQAALEAEAVKLKLLDDLKEKNTFEFKLNTEYSWRGQADWLVPTMAYDNGLFTYLIYDTGRSLPVLYKVNPDGNESLLNTSIDPDDRSIIRIHEVLGVVRARLDNNVIEIKNNKITDSVLNRSKTSKKDAFLVWKKLVPNEQ
jgi:type IV secretion system protein VirB9